MRRPSSTNRAPAAVRSSAYRSSAVAGSGPSRSTRSRHRASWSALTAPVAVCGLVTPAASPASNKGARATRGACT
ncbi:hypothetical protein GA0115253_1080613, partial [Streptomyces sp. Termitarium-T10T-6]